jgi:hypothetical protein
VEKTVLEFPQDGNWERLLFVFATFLSVARDVADKFFFTRPTWLHAETSAVWLWKHATSDFFCTRIQ